ncbi:hypothetical protein Hrd1104_00495 [Halorhabdus sp. CBA1104]|nr:hypothetical protein [Halorhabdus sp. CBA1104]QGN05917.1 hypothetical protein Hrd1104_00495 [Halorhabdus sp. CBA1104]
MSASAQALLAALGLGTGRVFGQVVGGWIANLVGVQDMYIFVVLGTGLAALLTVGFFHRGIRATQ